MEQQSGSGTSGNDRKNNFLFIGLAAVLILALGWYALFGRSSSEAAPGEEQTSTASTSVPAEEIADGIHIPTGLKIAEGFDIVRVQCTACHSGKLVAQNRATRDGWEEMIRWMQKTQGLWPLGENEPIILDYLATNYGPEETGRRANLEEVEWYILDLD